MTYFNDLFVRFANKKNTITKTLKLLTLVNSDTVKEIRTILQMNIDIFISTDKADIISILTNNHINQEFNKTDLTIVSKKLK